MTKAKETKKKATDKPGQESDVEGHNIFATHDYYTTRNIDRKHDLDRDIRDRQRAKEAETRKKGSR
jgi:hypothetical protein